MKIRRTKLSDLDSILELNEQAIPHVNQINKSDLKRFMKISSHFVLVEENDKIIAFMISLREGKKYKSLNYQFFDNHFSEFEYIDRIVVSENQRGNGIGKKLYEYLVENTSAPLLTCEVNIKPPNLRSLAFHEKMGFIEKSKLITNGGKKIVSLLVKQL